MSTKQWREVAAHSENANELARTLIAAADTCDQLRARDEANVRDLVNLSDENTSLRELLATAREDFHSIEALSQEGGFESTIEGTAKRAIAAIDAAIKTS